MKIAVATNNYKNLVGHVGMCKGFILYDVKDGNIIRREEIINPFSKVNNEESGGGGHRHHGGNGHNHDGGHHHHNHDELAEALKGIETMLCKKAGPGLIESLKERGIKILFTEERFGDDAVIKLEKGELNYIDPLLVSYN